MVAAYTQPGETLGLLPHQIMHAVGLGLTDLALGAAMVWDCVTCYKCQEYCPQGIQIAEVLYALKNLAWQQRATGSEPRTEVHRQEA